MALVVTGPAPKADQGSGWCQSAGEEGEGMKWECHDMETMRQFGSQFVCCTRGAQAASVRSVFKFRY